MGLSPSCQEKNQRNIIARSNLIVLEFLNAILLVFSEER
jgi:hypothetical protein